MELSRVEIACAVFNHKNFARPSKLGVFSIEDIKLRSLMDCGQSEDLERYRLPEWEWEGALAIKPFIARTENETKAHNHVMKVRLVLFL